MTQEMINKLPKWAQIELKRLQANVDALELKLAQFNGESETNTNIRYGTDLKPLPNNACIQFSIGDDEIEVRVNGDELDIHCAGFSNGKFVVMPKVANAIAVAIK